MRIARPWGRAAMLAAVLATLPLPAPAADVTTARVGQPAPDFTATDTHGKSRHLSEFKGRPVVLEWHNQGCPYVAKHYRSGNMQRLQKELTSDGAVWLTVISSAPGKQGNVTAAEADAYVAEQKASPTAVLLDPDGTVGRLYGAKTTPHMFLVDAQGTLVYAGAIDDKATTDVADVDGAKNYVEAAYRESKAGKAVTTSATAPYGCSVKYATP